MSQSTTIHEFGYNRIPKDIRMPANGRPYELSFHSFMSKYGGEVVPFYSHKKKFDRTSKTFVNAERSQVIKVHDNKEMEITFERGVLALYFETLAKSRYIVTISFYETNHKEIFEIDDTTSDETFHKQLTIISGCYLMSKIKIQSKMPELVIKNWHFGHSRPTPCTSNLRNLPKLKKENENNNEDGNIPFFWIFFFLYILYTFL